MSLLANFAGALYDARMPLPGDLRDAQQPSLVRRFAVYRNNYVLGLINALSDSFPVTRQLLGDACFQAIAHDFIRAHPPSSPALFEYGNALPTFLANTDGLSGYPYLPDVARLEYLRVQAWHAADATPLVSSDFAAWLATPHCLPGLRFELIPSASLLRSNWAVGSIWQSHQGSTPMQGFLLEQPESVLVIRPDDTVALHPVSESCAALLERLLEGECLADAIAAASHVVPDFDLGATLATVIALRCVRAITPT